MTCMTQVVSENGESFETASVPCHLYIRNKSQVIYTYIYHIDKNNTN